MSLSDNGPAIQASIQASHNKGLYASAWASTARLGNIRSEFDLTLGYAQEVRGTILDAGYVRYVYPGAPDLGEIYASASRTIGSVIGKIGVYYSWDTPGGRSAAYPYVDAGTKVAQNPPVTLRGHLGYFHYDHGQSAPYQNYADWNVGISTRLRGFDTSLTYASTNVGTEPGKRLAGPKVIFAIERSF